MYWLIVLIWLVAALILIALAVGAVVVMRTLKTKAEAENEKAPPAPAPDEAVSLRAAESLSDMIRFRTVSGRGGSGEDSGAQFNLLHAYLERRYPLAHSIMEREKVGLSLIFRWRSPDPQGDPVLFCAHLDVVPAQGEWEHAPFSGDIADGYVFGRGAIDCKNVVVGLMEAAEALCGEGFSPSRDIYFAFGHDEETGGSEGAGRIAEIFMQNGIRFEMVLDEGSFISRGDISAKQLLATVGVSEKGFMNFTMTAHSRGGHASTPPRHTAVGAVSEAVCRLEYKLRPARLQPVVLEYLKGLEPDSPFAFRMMLENLWLFRRALLRSLSKNPARNALIRTTIACTMAQAGTAPNVLPETAQVVCNCRPVHGETCEEILRFVRSLTHGLDIEVDAQLTRDASSISDYRGLPFQTLRSVIRETFGKIPVVPGIISGGTDARKYEPLSASVFRFMPFVLTPFDSAKMHACNESVRIESLGMAVEFYKRLIGAVAGWDRRDG